MGEPRVRFSFGQHQDHRLCPQPKQGIRVSLTSGSSAHSQKFETITVVNGYNSRELTKRRRRRQRRRYKTIGLVSKNIGSARSARAFYILVHFFAVIS